MEGPLEVKDSTANTEEHIKSEAPVQNPDSSDRSDGAASPPPNCSICLGKLVNTSFTDSCLHQFCFTCLLQWSKIKTECPLCKQTFKSIIHNVRSEEDYDQYHVPRELASQIAQPQVVATFDLNAEADRDWELSRLLQRATVPGNWRHGLVLNPEQVARREQLPSVAPQVSRDERRQRRTNPTDYRRSVYRRGIWASALPDVFGRFRESSADYYRRELRELNRLIPWLNRELQVLLNANAHHVAYVMRIILESLTQYDIMSPSFRDLVRPYFGMHTAHFVHELLNYARSNFDLVGYDESVIYVPQGLSNGYTHSISFPFSSSSTNSSSSSSTTSDDSDVRVLDEAIDLRVNTEIPSVGPHLVDMPGPSNIGAAFQVHYNMPQVAPVVPDILTISSTSDDDFEVIGYVKPRHERTPEIIELSSDPEEVNVSHAANENVQSLVSTFYGDDTEPSTSHTVRKPSPSLSTDSDSDSDINYNSRRIRRYQKRTKRLSKKSPTAKRRKRSIDSKSRNRERRNLSSSEESESRKRGIKRRIQRGMKKRVCSTSDSSSQETELKKTDEKRSRKVQFSARGTVRVRKDLIKRENRCIDSSSSDSSSESDQNIKSNKSHTVRKSKRKYAFSSSDYGTGSCGRVTRAIRKTRQLLVSLVSSKKSDRKEQKYIENRQSRSRSSSKSSYTSQKEERVNFRHRESERDKSELKKYESKHRSKIRKPVISSSDSDEGRFRSNSQCSDHSSKTYGHWKKSSHKDRRKSKERKRSSSRTHNPSQSSSSLNNSTASNCSKPDSHSASKHSESKSSSGSKERHKSRKSYKRSKHRRSQSDTK